MRKTIVPALLAALFAASLAFAKHPDKENQNQTGGGGGGGDGTKHHHPDGPGPRDGGDNPGGNGGPDLPQ